MNRNADHTSITFGLIGSRGFGREIMTYVQATLPGAFPQKTVEIVFVETEPETDEVNGVPLISEKQFLAADSSEKFFNVAIANSKVREEIAARIIDQGVRPLSVKAPATVDLGHNDIGMGAILCSFSHIKTNVRIGKFFHCNTYSYVAHDCHIGDFVTFAPGVHCNGNVHIGHHAYIGAGAILRQGTPERPLLIGEGAVVGMGAVVTKNVAPRTTVIGNPAKPMIKK